MRYTEIAERQAKAFLSDHGKILQHAVRSDGKNAAAVLAVKVN
jgi:hypothetical protein